MRDGIQDRDRELLAEVVAQFETFREALAPVTSSAQQFAELVRKLLPREN